MIELKNVSKWYGEFQVLNNCSVKIEKKDVMVICGPSGSGKSTLIKCVNGLEDIQKGEIFVGETKVNNNKTNLNELRAKIGMVFQKPNPFPKSIFENVAYGPRIHGLAKSNDELDELVTKSLIKAGLFEEIKDRIHEPGTSLSGGQQQRLCIARTIAISPQIILMDEPCSALDPIATAVIEELIDELAKNYTIVIVTHSMQQAARVSQQTAFFHMGSLIEVGRTDQIFSTPSQKKTQDYITGKIG